MKKIAVSWILCVLVLVALMTWLGSGLLPGTAKDNGEKALIEGKFTLQGADGSIVTEKNFHGKYMLVYFGYTHCPDMCPTSLLLMQNVLARLGALAEKVQPIFISVDPARDTPQLTNTYASHFGPHMIGLSGSEAQVHEAAEHFKIYYGIVEDKHSALGYSVDHSGFIYLMDKNGHYLTHFPYNVSERAFEESVKHYVK